MNEDFLHYLWHYQKFDKSNLKTTDNNLLVIHKPGYYNTDSGPDFLEGRLRIGKMEWAGNIEIHVKSSDWYRHNHQHDAAFDNVVLHVVWEHDKEVFDKAGKPIPTLELQNLTPSVLRKHYKSLIDSKNEIPCSGHFSNVSEIRKVLMLERALMQRLERKSKEVLTLLERNTGDWEETAFQLLMRNLGFKLNNESLLKLSGRLPFKLLKKYAQKPIALEALLFGMAGLLEETDDYTTLLCREFSFLSAKHSLAENRMHKSEWKFMRTRPSNFPTVRLAELASILSGTENLFAKLIESEEAGELRKLFQRPVSDYWQTHYSCGKQSSKRLRGLGVSSASNLVVNTAVPLMVAYSKYMDDESYLEKAVGLLEGIGAEKNRITESWSGMGLPLKTMADSQGSIELFNEFCKQKRCTSCGIGVAILG